MYMHISHTFSYNKVNYRREHVIKKIKREKYFLNMSLPTNNLKYHSADLFLGLTAIPHSRFSEKNKT